MSTLPVTVLSGFLGSGKTTLLNHLLTHSGGRRYAVLVNDMAEINFDAMSLQPGRTPLTHAAGSLGGEGIVELHNGCICCSLRDEFVSEVARLARLGRFDHLIVEATGVAEPLPLAMAFDHEEPEGELLASVAQIDTMVTVVDAKNFLTDWNRGEDLVELGIATDRLDNRTLADLLAEQVEFANLLVINKADLVDAAELEKIRRILTCLNPEAKIETTMFGVLDADRLIGTQAYVETQALTPAEVAERENLLSTHSELGIGSFVYRARRPFHPERLWTRLHEVWPGVMRSKGLFWLATRMNDSGLWSQAGQACSHQTAGRWWSSVPADMWPDDELIRESIASEFEGEYGDRRQELVIIGTELDQETLRAELDACLLDDSEMRIGPLGWRHLPDPFPEWEDDQLDETDLAVLTVQREVPTA